MHSFEWNFEVVILQILDCMHSDQSSHAMRQYLRRLIYLVCSLRRLRGSLFEYMKDETRCLPGDAVNAPQFANFRHSCGAKAWKIYGIHVKFADQFRE